ncbi:LysE family translocator [Glaciimonas immobilis]|uniref:Threonine/homoserine/homoserine lactone efflux protein n=1 Tax=Glaciimonas immobilis TaxID=728004 RepID=A0A840RMM3_9BURK|nr:LysE family translocator [Glaciimonas immobilis]KAF3998935.1 LysE family translocator [Glaciimonas immobilis]MBB5198342.1 threonine/homoserine/homoserine lactone efflux protein [Glaciimonas immobilis]
MQLQTWLFYLAAVAVLVATPGPTVLSAVTNAVNHGVRRALIGACGSLTAVCLIMTVSAFGIGAVLTSSEKIFLTIKWCGAAYLIYIGIKAFCSGQTSFDVDTGIAQAKPAASHVLLRLYLNGFLVGASNPKALIFFTALFPQFLDPQAPQIPQFLILGITFICCELIGLTFYSSFAVKAAPWLRMQGRARLFNRISGSVFVGAGVALATVKHSTK